MSTEPPSDRNGEHAGESFLGRQTFGVANYLLIALAVTLALGFIPRGVRKTLQGNSNNAEDWLPASYAESADLAWFREHFAGEAFVLVSWDGCKLRDRQQLLALEKALREVTDEEGWAWYPRVRSGASTIDDLVTGPAALSRSAAVARLEGALVGPAEIGPDGQPLGDGTRTTCLLAYLDDRLTKSNLPMRKAVERVRDLVAESTGLPVEAIHLGGPPVDNITIDIEGEKTLLRLAGLSGLIGLTLAYLCFRSGRLTAMVFWAAGASAGMSLSLVYWYGGFEMLALGLDAPRLGRADAILMSMPAVVYVLALSGAIHLVNYYRDERLELGVWGAAERAARVAWKPCLLAAVTTAVGLGSLGSSEILPIQKFGVFSALGVMVSVCLLFGMLPIFLHRFPPGKHVIEQRAAQRKQRVGRPWYGSLAGFVTTRHGLTSVLCLALMAAVAIGLNRTTTSVQVLGLLDENCQLIQDYGWLEENLGNLVPMEVIVALEADQLRSPDEPAIDRAAAEPRYRMTMYERAEMARRLQASIETLPEVSRALSAATFASDPQAGGGSAGARRAYEFTASEKLEESRDDLREYLVAEWGSDREPTGRELWRVSARVTALQQVDYGRFVADLEKQVDPVLRSYQLRDALVRSLVASEKSRVCLLTGSQDEAIAADEKSLVELLRSSDEFRKRVTVYTPAKHEATNGALVERLNTEFEVFALDAGLADQYEGLLASKLATPDSPASRPTAYEAQATYTGVVPVVYKTQRELLKSLWDSILWATVLIAGVMSFVLRNPLAGFASMIPNVFPVVMVFGALGWLAIPVDIGIMMTASVALGVAVDDTLHFVTWFGRGVRQEGLDRRSAVLLAYERCATAMTQTTLIGGLGFAAFSVSTFTPTQQIGCLMIVILAIALVGDLVLLPALLCGPLGRFFAPGAPATPPADLAIAEVPDVEPPASEGPQEELPKGDESNQEEPEVSLAKSMTPDSEGMSESNAALRSRLRKFRRNASS